MELGPVMVTVGTGLTTKANESDMGPVQAETTVFETLILYVPAALGVTVMVGAFVAEGFNPAKARVVQLLAGLALPIQL